MAGAATVATSGGGGGGGGDGGDGGGSGGGGSSSSLPILKLTDFGLSFSGRCAAHHATQPTLPRQLLTPSHTSASAPLLGVLILSADGLGNCYAATL